MKINEIIQEAGFWKGVAKAIAPQTVQTYDRQKNALRTPRIDPSMANVASSTSNVATTTSQVATTPKLTATSLDINKIRPAPKSGLPTSDEQAKFDAKIKAAMDAQK